MTRLHAQLRMLILDGGYDLPDGAVLPPMDLVEDELRKLGGRVSRLAVALGMEAELQICASLVPKARSRVEIRHEMKGFLLIACATAVQLGIDPGDLMDEAMRDLGATRELLNGAPQRSARKPAEVGGPSTAPVSPCSAQDDRRLVGAGATDGRPS